MNLISDVLFSNDDRKTWLIVGASRGIGLEFVRQLLIRGDKIIATVRETFASHASALWGQAGSDSGRCQMFICDVLSEKSIIVCSHNLQASGVEISSNSAVELCDRHFDDSKLEDRLCYP